MIIIFILLFSACNVILVHCLNMFKHKLITGLGEELSSSASEMPPGLFAVSWDLPSLQQRSRHVRPRLRVSAP